MNNHLLYLLLKTKEDKIHTHQLAPRVCVLWCWFFFCFKISLSHPREPPTWGRSQNPVQAFPVITQSHFLSQGWKSFWVSSTKGKPFSWRWEKLSPFWLPHHQAVWSWVGKSQLFWDSVFPFTKVLCQHSAVYAGGKLRGASHLL